VIPLQVVINGDNCWPDLKDEKGQPTHITGQLTGIARLPRGTELGRSTVTIRVELPDGRTVLAETTLSLMNGAMTAFNAADQMERGF
jgi:hypothetical protein